MEYKKGIADKPAVAASIQSGCVTSEKIAIGVIKKLKINTITNTIVIIRKGDVLPAKILLKTCTIMEPTPRLAAVVPIAIQEPMNSTIDTLTHLIVSLSAPFMKGG